MLPGSVQDIEPPDRIAGTKSPAVEIQRKPLADVKRATRRNVESAQKFVVLVCFFFRERSVSQRFGGRCIYLFDGGIFAKVKKLLDTELSNRSEQSANIRFIPPVARSI
ncbi:hypothetical protein X773_31295 [Mesorhizobium sp. LSJC285A00]|nr:hypothetical protein X773_31295 [Mesorhizobium sp. LSJC285A00]